MKSFSLTFALFCIFGSLSAQTPDYFANNPNWNENYTGGTPFTSFYAGSNLMYLDGDSTIGSNTYHKIYKDGQDAIGLSFPPNNYTQYNHVLYLLVRQENRKIYYFDETLQADTLLISYESSPGSQLECANFIGSGQVVAVDSLQIGSEYRRLLYLDTNSNNLWYLVEGVGYIQTISNDYFGGGIGTNIFTVGVESLIELCYGQNGSALFPEVGNGTLCHLTQLGTEDLPSDHAEITYNPTMALIQISGEEEGLHLTVWNSLGQVILRSDQSSVSSAELANGV